MPITVWVNSGGLPRGIKKFEAFFMLKPLISTLERGYRLKALSTVIIFKLRHKRFRILPTVYFLIQKSQILWGLYTRPLQYPYHTIFLSNFLVEELADASLFGIGPSG